MRKGNLSNIEWRVIRNPVDFLWLTPDRPAVDFSAPAAAAGHRDDATTGLIQRRVFIRIRYVVTATLSLLSGKGSRRLRI